MIIFVYIFFRWRCGTQFYDSGDLCGGSNVALRSRAILVNIAPLPDMICWILAIYSLAVKKSRNEKKIK